MLARCFLFLFCGEGMTAGHGLCFVLPVRRGKGLTFQFVATQSALACSCLVGIIVSISVLGVS